MHQKNPLSPLRLSPEKRIHEIAGILADGLIRLKQPTTNQPQLPDPDSQTSLAMSSDMSVHGYQNQYISEET